MKAVVVEVKGRDAVVLSKDGQFLKVRNRGPLQIGGEIDLAENVRALPSRTLLMRTVAAAAAFVFSIGVGYGAYSYYTPYSYIDLDINPSVEIVANRYDRILKVEAMNEDGARVLEEQNFKNKSLDYAVEEIIKKASDKGYMPQDVSNAVMVTVSSKAENKSQEVEKKVQEAAKDKINSSGVNADLLVEKVTLERHEEARQLDISPGKLLLIERLQEVNPEAKVEEYKNSPVRDILKAINTETKEEQKDEKLDSKDKEQQKAQAKETVKEGTRKESTTPTPNSTDKDKKDKGNEGSKDDKKDESKNNSTDKKGSTSNGKSDPKATEDSTSKDKKDKTESNNGKGSRNK